MGTFDDSVYDVVNDEIRADWLTHPYADPPTLAEIAPCEGCGQHICDQECP
jgi:hypothetical protein